MFQFAVASSSLDPSTPPPVRCDGRLEVIAVPGVALLEAGDDLGEVLVAAVRAARFDLFDGDVVVVASKAVSRAEGRFVDLREVEISPAAAATAQEIGKDPRMVELILRESQRVSRKAPGVLVVQHRLGFVTANAGIDCSNAVPAGAAAGSGPWALLLPLAPDASAERVRAALHGASGARVAVVISDSFGRPFRVGTVGAAIGVAGLPPLWDRRGEADLFGRVLEQTVTALADQVAAAADLVAGQAAERRAAVVVRGLSFAPSDRPSTDLLRPPGQDLYL